MNEEIRKDQKFDALFQGGLVKIKTYRPVEEEIENRGGKRGKIMAFSPASRKRLLELFASLHMPRKIRRGDNPPIFITLTYPAIFPSVKVSKGHLRAFLKRLDRFASREQPHKKLSAVWRLEFQERGAPHYHIVVFNLPFLPMDEMQQMWADIIKADRPFTRIEKIETHRKLLSYVAKYVAKVAKFSITEDGRLIDPSGEIQPFPAEGGDGSGFNYLAYLAAAGRWWGYFRKEALPFAEAVALTVSGDMSIYYNFRRAAKRFYKRLPRHRDQNSFTLFCGSADRWYELLQQMLITGCEFSGRKSSLSRAEIKQYSRVAF